jgi:hypothetical protein
MSRLHPDTSFTERAPIVGHRFRPPPPPTVYVPARAFMHGNGFRDLEAKVEGEGADNTGVEPGRGAALLMSDGSCEVNAITACCLRCLTLEHRRSATASSLVMAFFQLFGAHRY